METILSKKLCTGCTACMNICPKGAISMVKKSDGFKYPEIDSIKCVNCKMCKDRCPVLNTKRKRIYK